MKIIIKHILKSIYEKKLRTCLIIFSIMISPALFFSSVSMSNTMVKMKMEDFRQKYGYSDIIIEKSFDSPSNYFSLNSAEEYKSDMEYFVGEISGYASYTFGVNKKEGFNLRGIDLNDLNKITPLSLYKEYNINSFDGMKAVISKATSEKYNLNIGQSFILDINGNRYRFTISGISQPTGPFINDSNSPVIVIPRETAAKIYNARGMVNLIYAKLKDPNETGYMVYQLASAYPRYIVREPFSQGELKSESDKLAVPFMILTVILSFMSIYIIYSMSKVIVTERLPVMGVFRSVGSTKTKTTILLLSESILYGIIGGILSCGLGMGILYLMSYLTRPIDSVGVKVTILYKVSTLLWTAFIAIFLSIVSSIIPIIKASKIPIKDIILNSVEDNKRGKVLRIVFGITLLIITVVLPHMETGNLAVIVDTLCIFLSIFATVLIIPYAVKLSNKVFERAYGLFFGNEGIIAAKNLRDNQSFLSNVTLISIAISCLLMVNIVVKSSINEILDYYQTHKYQITLNMNNMTINKLGMIKSISGVKDVMGMLSTNYVETGGYSTPIGQIEGVDPYKYLEFVTPQIENGSPDIFTKLNDGKNIIIGKRLQSRYGVKVGDSIYIKSSGVTYKIIGIIESFDFNGDFGIISELNFKSDFKTISYPSILIKTNENEAKVEKSIKAALSKEDPKVYTEDYLKESSLESNKNLFIIIKGFSALSVLAGTIGICNNLFIYFLQKKRYIAMYRSVGMDKHQSTKINLIEAMTEGVLGALIGILNSLIILSIIPKILNKINLGMKLTYSTSDFIVCLVFALLISEAAAIIPIINSLKINLVESIKCE